MCAIHAILCRAIPASQYSNLDDVLTSKYADFLGRKRQQDILDDDSLTSHQTFLLAISDQSLITGVGSLIALYAQMCNGLSTFSFQLGLSLAMFCAGIHLNTLSALQIYLRNYRKQAFTRIILMVIFLIFILPSIVLQFASYTCGTHQLTACCIRTTTAGDLETDILTWIALVVLMLYQYYHGILGLRPLTLTERIQGERYSAFTLVMTSNWIPWTAAMRKDIKSALERRREENDQADKQVLDILGSHIQHPPLKLLRILVLYVWDDTFNSLVADTFSNQFWFVSTMIDIVSQFREENIDFGPLLSWNYGQVVPLLLLLVYLLTFLEVESGKIMGGF